ncbi:uncharacterized protein DFE_1389 [Desulfovibrio ferrophilus]|uniref:Uncharacterized protein n=1 Tax=Desulfovibrio ferrophilus TaxID=241368 RepID=A0A2Z6AY64_9BACT|nr:uncharacterized protein DFE_1389 [Desulfovibrio ferrophilus]
MLLAATVALGGQDGGCPVSISVETGIVSDADYDDREGGFSVLQADVSMTYDILRLSYGVRSYDWNDRTGLPFGNGVDDPWDQLHEIELSAHDRGRINSEWGWFYVAGVSAAYEEEMDDSLGMFVGGGASYALSDAWAVQMGVGVAGHKIRWAVVPILGVMWNQGVEQGFSARIGFPEAELVYRFDPQWAVHLAGRVEYDLWRLADDSTVRSKGYLEESGIRVGLYGDWTPTKELFVRFGPEFIFARETTFYNSDGDEQNSYNSGATVGGSFSIGYHF